MKQAAERAPARPKKASSKGVTKGETPSPVGEDLSPGGPVKRIFKSRRGYQVGSGLQAHDAVVAGVPGYALVRVSEALRDLPASSVLNAIGVSERTAHRIKANPERQLDTKTTDGIYRLESVRALAADVLGSEDAANEWLNTEAIGLEYRKPIDLLSTSPGAEAVKTLLQRMKYGVYA